MASPGEVHSCALPTQGCPRWLNFYAKPNVINIKPYLKKKKERPGPTLKKNSLSSLNTIGSNPGKGGRALKLNAYGRTILSPEDEESVSHRVYPLCHRSQLRVLGVRAHAPPTLSLLPLAPVFSTASETLLYRAIRGHYNTGSDDPLTRGWRISEPPTVAKR